MEVELRVCVVIHNTTPSTPTYKTTQNDQAFSLREDNKEGPKVTTLGGSLIISRSGGQSWE